MSIFIKGLNVPDKYPVEVIINPTGEAFVNYGPYFETLEAVNVPAPHGRLIDADELRFEIEKYFNGLPIQGHYDMLKLVNEAPTIIEAEGEAEE